jgi:hypothetical protein
LKIQTVQLREPGERPGIQADDPVVASLQRKQDREITDIRQAGKPVAAEVQNLEGRQRSQPADAREQVLIEVQVVHAVEARERPIRYAGEPVVAEVQQLQIGTAGEHSRGNGRQPLVALRGVADTRVGWSGVGEWRAARGVWDGLGWWR